MIRHQIANNFEFTNTIITAVAGLLGVIIGAFISYWFSKKLSDGTQKARVAVARKNLIYAKLYKELLSVQKSMNSLPKDVFYFELFTNAINTNETRHRWSEGFSFEGKRYPKAELLIWHDMKADIRHTLVSSKIKNALDGIELCVIDYFDSLVRFMENKTLLEEKEGSAMLAIYQKDRTNHNSIFYINFWHVFVKGATAQNIADATIKNFGFTHNTELQVAIKELSDKIMALPEIKDIELKYANLQKSVSGCIDTLKILILEVVNKYEYGESI